MRVPSAKEIREKKEKGGKEEVRVLWEETVVKTISKTITAVYCISLITVFIRLQINLMNRFIFSSTFSNCNNNNDNNDNNNNEEDEFGMMDNVNVDSTAQAQYLMAVDFLLHSGVENLCDDVKNAVESTLRNNNNNNNNNIDLASKLNRRDIVQIFANVRKIMEFNGLGNEEDSIPFGLMSDMRKNLNKSKLIKYLLENEEEKENETNENDNQGKKLKYPVTLLLNETRDILESPNFELVLGTCLDEMFKIVLNKIIKELDNTNTNTNNNNNNDSISDMDTIPLVKLGPLVQKYFAPILSKHEESSIVLRDILELRMVDDFSFKVFTAFHE